LKNLLHYDTYGFPTVTSGDIQTSVLARLRW